MDENQNILYYATLNFFQAYDLNNSSPLYQITLPRTTNIYVGSNTVWVTVGTYLGQIQNREFVPKADLSKIVSPTGTILKGAVFDEESAIMSGAFGQAGQTPTIFMLALDNFKLISKYQPKEGDSLSNFNRMGWFCNGE